MTSPPQTLITTFRLTDNRTGGSAKHVVSADRYREHGDDDDRGPAEAQREGTVTTQPNETLQRTHAFYIRTRIVPSAAPTA